MMLKPYQLLVFDWEGTLGEDTVGQVLRAIDDAAHRLSLGVVNHVLARQSASLGLVGVISKLFPFASIHQQEQLLNEVHTLLANDAVERCLIPGAKTLVEQVVHAGFDVAIATNKGHASLQRVLRATGFDAYFKVTRSAGQVPPKPCPQMLEELMAAFDVNAANTLMLGDSVLDIEMARACGVDAVGVDVYQLNGSALLEAGASTVCVDYQQVADFLKLNQVTGEGRSS